NRVAAFKQAVRAGSVPTDVAAQQDQPPFDDYFREHSGLKRGKRKKEFEYISRHGDIVDALKRWREQAARGGELIVKNVYVDLGIKVKGRLAALYEVKT